MNPVHHGPVDFEQKTHEGQVSLHTKCDDIGALPICLASSAALQHKKNRERRLCHLCSGFVYGGQVCKNLSPPSLGRSVFVLTSLLGRKTVVTRTKSKKVLLAGFLFEVSMILLAIS